MKYKTKTKTRILEMPSTQEVGLALELLENARGCLMPDMRQFIRYELKWLNELVVVFTMKFISKDIINSLHKKHTSWPVKMMEGEYDNERVR